MKTDTQVSQGGSVNMKISGRPTNMRKTAAATALLTLLLPVFATANTTSLARDGRGTEGEGTQGRASVLRLAQGETTAKIAFNIPAQPLNQALNNFAQQ